MEEDLFPTSRLSPGPDIIDAVEVFLYRNLSGIISPDPSILITPAFRASLQVALNDVGIRHNMGLADDLRDILDVFVCQNAGTLSVSTTP